MGEDTRSRCRQHDPCPTTAALYEKITAGATGADLAFWTDVFNRTRAGLLLKGWAGHTDEIERAYRLAHMPVDQLAQRRRALMRGALPFAAQTHCRQGHPLEAARIRRDGRRECRKCKKARDDARRNRCASGGEPYTGAAKGVRVEAV